MKYRRIKIILLVVLCASLCFFAFQALYSVPFSSHKKVKDYVSQQFFTNKSEFESIVKTLDNFTNQCSKKKMAVYAPVKFFRLEVSYLDSTYGYVDDSSCTGLLPIELYTQLNILGTNTVYLDSFRYCFAFHKSIYTNGEVYLIYKLRPDLKYFVENFSMQDKNDWLYIIDDNWAIYAKKN